MQVAIDGPAGAGKSSIAKALADTLGFIHIDTGAMYRALTWLALEKGLALTDEAGLTALADKADIVFRREGDSQEVYCQGEKITSAIRQPKVSKAVSQVAAISGVRQALTDSQQQMAQGRNVVMDGRDIGTVVLPQAECKIYLTAAPEVRAARRLAQLKGSGQASWLPSLDQVIAEIKERDEKDMNRNDSPLRPAEDSILLDTSNLTFAQVLEEAAALVQRSRSPHEHIRKN